MRHRRGPLVSLLSIAACTPASPAPPPVASPTAPPAAAETIDAPAGTMGVCPDLATPPPSELADDDPMPAAFAHCADVDELSRVDGLGEPDDPLPGVVPSQLPSWDLEALREFACAYACSSAGAKAYLLAWHVIEDGRPLRNHNALYLVEHGGTPARWTAVIMYRHATNAWWNLNHVSHSSVTPVRSYDHRPTPAELYQHAEDNHWDWVGDDDWVILAGNVIDALWPAATGAAASRFYPAAVER